MNCKAFQDIVNDLARSKILDAAARDAGIAHAATCGSCASRLADERALCAGLKSLAASDEGKSAPDSVEIALLGAFRSHASNQARPVRSRIRLPLAMAAAALILVASGFVVYRAIRNKERANDRSVAKTEAPPRFAYVEQQVALNTVGSKPNATRKHHAGRPRPKAPFIIDSMTTPANDVGYTTDFYPLSYDGDLKTMEIGEMIRVQVPCSALIKFGLPVSAEREDIMVKADLLIGEDGMARFIRFVF